jgi:hypothetical protein
MICWNCKTEVIGTVVNTSRHVYCVACHASDGVQAVPCVGCGRAVIDLRPHVRWTVCGRGGCRDAAQHASRRDHHRRTYRPAPRRATECRGCGEPIPVDRGPRALYCTKRCRDRAWRRSRPRTPSRPKLSQAKAQRLDDGAVAVIVSTPGRVTRTYRLTPEAAQALARDLAASGVGGG